MSPIVMGKRGGFARESLMPLDRLFGPIHTNPPACRLKSVLQTSLRPEGLATGDSNLFVSPVDEAWRIRTNEQGEETV